MHLARLLLLLELLLASCTAPQRTQPPSPRSAAPPPPIVEAGQATAESSSDHPESSSESPAGSVPAADLTPERARIEEANAARTAGDHDLARAKLGEAVASLLARPPADQDAGWVRLLDAAGIAAWQVQDPHTARAAFERVLEVQLRTFPEDHPAVQQARSNLANALAEIGDLQAARDLEEKVLEISSRTLPDDDPDLQRARLNFSSTLFTLGDVRGAETLLRKVLEVYSRTLPEEHLHLQMARRGLANVLSKLGDLEGALELEEKVLEIYQRTLPDEHVELQHVRINLTSTLQAIGEFQRARTLAEKVLEVSSRTLQDDHDDLQKARLNLAEALSSVGDLQAARGLQEKALEVYSRTLPDEHPHLQTSRLNLAVTLSALGDVRGALALEEKVLEVRERTLSDDHPDLQVARGNLANTLASAGDLELASALEEKVLEVDERTLPVDHPEIQRMRQNHGLTLRSLGDFAGARVLQEKVCAAYSRTLPDDHTDLQAARAALATTIGHQVARSSRAHEFEGKPSAEEEQARERCVELIGGLCRAQVRAARAAILESPSREAEERCARLARFVDVSVSFAGGYGAFEPLRELEPASFLLAETTRGAALVSAELARGAAQSPKYESLRLALREASDGLARLAQEGTTSASFGRALARRESAERELVALARVLTTGAANGLEFDVESLAARLPDGAAAVAFRCFQKTRVDLQDEPDPTGQPAVRESSVEGLCAFVVRSSGAAAQPGIPAPSTLTLVDLGPVAPIEAAVRAWRDGLGVGSDGRGVSAAAGPLSTAVGTARASALRERIFDPLLPALAGAETIVVALDGVLHLVSLDALPLDGRTLLGDRWRIETRTTLTELLRTREVRTNAGELVAVGDVDYGAVAIFAGSGAAPLLAATDLAQRADADAGILRGSAWSGGFSALPDTGREVQGIAETFRIRRDRSGAEAETHLCVQASATRERLLSLAPKARWLHVATHGWFAPESIRSWSDAEPLDRQTGLGSRPSGAEQVKGMSPMLLCGLALAGANLPADAAGRVPGLLTAEELSTLELTNCELVVLSACDTNVGELGRAGQGVASLQKALQMAGARSVITSLWKVPDEATKELMVDFYRRLWVEKKSKHQALWEAKRELRNAVDERGAPKYTTRDWGAWVLTGEPD